MFGLDDPKLSQLFRVAAVVIGIAIALLFEWKRRPNGRVGLGVVGAIAVDLCAALSLAGWLLVGGLDLPVRGRVLLWLIVALLVGVSGLGLLMMAVWETVS